ncbi:MAG TPA: hypothetical protein VNU01_05770 [Egibacteraceae bacterium]|nr:hypothetical protein [Egibacteraceae bacterium]
MSARFVAASVALLAAAVLFAAPPTDDSGRPRAEDVARLRRVAYAELRVDGPRPPFRPYPAAAIGLATPAGDPPRARGRVQTVAGPREDWRLALADGALPFTYEVDRELARRVGLGTVIEAVSAWDGVTGSRWRTRFAGLSRRPLDEAYPDGRSTVYLRTRCPAGLLGSVRWQLGPSVATLDVRGGTGAVFTSEVDIAVCPLAERGDRVRRTLLHEVGHVMGLEHLCERGRPCPPAVDGVPADCRVMHWLLRGCGERIRDAERDLARHLYPTLPRLWGPGAAETAVRASYATVPTQSARRVVLARPGTHPWLLAPVLLEAAPDDAPLLFAEPELGGCVPAPAGGELARAAGPGAEVLLVGAWPPSCDEVLAGWGLRVRRRMVSPSGHGWTGADRMRAQIDAAELVLRRHAEDGRPSTELVLAPLPAGVHAGPLDGEETALAWSAAAVAAARRAPLLLVAGPRLPSAVAAFLREHAEIRTVHAVGGATRLHPLLLHQLRRTGRATTRASGVSAPRVTAATAAAFNAGAPLFAAPVATPDEQALAASLAARTGGMMAVVGGGSARPLRDAAAPRRPAGGALVAGPGDVPATVHWSLTEVVLPASDPRLDVERVRAEPPGSRLREALGRAAPHWTAARDGAGFAVGPRRLG